MSKLQLQMHFGEKPYECCRKVLVLTLRFTMAEHRFSDTQQLRIVGLFSSIQGHVSRRMFTCRCPFWHAAGSTAVWVGGVSTRGLLLGLAFPVQCVPQPFTTLPAAAPPSEMAQPCPGTPETLLQGCGPCGGKFLAYISSNLLFLCLLFISPL